MNCSVGIYVFDGMEVLDFAGPYEVLTTASRLQQQEAPAAAIRFSLFTVGREPGTVRARGGLPLVADYAMAAHPAMELLLVPGGVVEWELGSPQVADWIASVSATARLTASVCTGAFLLAQAGLLNGRRATTHWEDLDALQQMFPAVQVEADRRWVDEDTVVTSAGISAGIDMSLHLVERLAGRDLAERTARQMAFDWQEA